MHWQIDLNDDEAIVCSSFLDAAAFGVALIHAHFHF